MATYADGPYGVTIGLNPGGTGSPANYNTWTQLFADMTALGLTWLRFQLSWKNIEQSQGTTAGDGTYTVGTCIWTPLDDAVSHCNAAQMNLCLTVRGAPTWALATPSQQATDEPFYLPDPQMFAGFAKAMASRYNGASGFGTIQAIEFGNEDPNIHHTPPNLGYHGLHISPYAEYYDVSHSGLVTNNPVSEPSRDPYWFANIVPYASAAVRSVHPRCLIGLGAIWWRQYPNVYDFIRGFYAQIPGFKSMIDWVNLHFYSNSSDPTTDGTPGTSGFYTPSIGQTLTAIQQALTDSGDPTKRLWLTEFGWGTNTNNGASQDTDTTTQAWWYAGRNDASWAYSTASAPSGSAPFYTQNKGYVMEAARTSGVCAKIFLYTLSYKAGSTSGTETDTSSLVQFSTDGLGTRTNLPAYTAVQKFTQKFPQWSGGVATKTVVKVPVVPGQKRHIVR